MRTWIVVFVAAAVVSGCAPWMDSRVEMTSTKAVPVVANCIGQQWSRQYAVSVAESSDGVNVRASLGANQTIQANVSPRLHGSRVSLSTRYHPLVLDSDPLIAQARACAA